MDLKDINTHLGGLNCVWEVSLKVNAWTKVKESL